MDLKYSFGQKFGIGRNCVLANVAVNLSEFEIPPTWHHGVSFSGLPKISKFLFVDRVLFSSFSALRFARNPLKFVYKLSLHEHVHMDGEISIFLFA